MNRETFAGLVLENQPYKERDAILKVADKDRIRSVYARGVLGPKSKNRRLCNVFSKTCFDVQPGEMDRLVRGDLLFYAGRINEDLEMSAVCQYLNSVLLHVGVEEAICIQLERLWQVCEEKGDWMSEAAILLKEIIEREGIVPYVDGCVYCGSSRICGLSIGQAGFLCPEHKGLEQEWERQDLQRMRALFKAERKDYPVLKEHFQYSLEDILFLGEWLGWHAHLDLAAFRFLKSTAALAKGNGK